LDLISAVREDPAGAGRAGWECADEGAARGAGGHEVGVRPLVFSPV